MSLVLMLMWAMVPSLCQEEPRLSQVVLSSSGAREQNDQEHGDTLNEEKYFLPSSLLPSHLSFLYLKKIPEQFHINHWIDSCYVSKKQVKWTLCPSDR